MFSILSTLLAHLPFAADTPATETVCAQADSFLGVLPTWYEYLPLHRDLLGQCSPDFVFPGSIFPVALAVLDIMMRLAGFLAVISIILGGVQYIISLGDEEKGKSARRRVQNSVIGLVIVFVATAMVSFIGRRFG